VNAGKILGQIVLALLFISVLLLVVKLLGNEDEFGSEKLVGGPVPEFAAPLAGSGLSGDSNVFQLDQVREKGVPFACNVTTRGAFVSCRDLGPSAAVVFWTPGSKKCVEQVDEIDRYVTKARTRPDVVAVALRPDPGQAERLARERGWKLPVAVDRDGAVGILYNVGACPTTFFIREGEITGVRIGLIGATELERGLRVGAATSATGASEVNSDG
jgi:hypothetical protein